MFLHFVSQCEQTRKQWLACLICLLQTCSFAHADREINVSWAGTLETCGLTRKHCFHNKNVSDFFGNILASREGKFYSRNNVSRGGKTGKHQKKHNVSATMFPGLPRA